MIPMKKSEILDRWTILNMKVRLDERVLVEMNQYDQELQKIIDEATVCPMPFIKTLCALQEANSKIWVLEASLRQEYKDDPSNTGEVTDVELGKRAKLIREHNKTRIKAKQEIDKMFGENQDFKVDHASQ